MGKNMSPAPGHHLLPHERWFASYMLNRPRKSALENPSALRMEQNYGPVGMALFDACMITMFPGMFVGLLGMTLFIFNGDGFETMGYRLSELGVILVLLGSIRLGQASKAGRAFRGDRPFIRP